LTNSEQFAGNNALINVSNLTPFSSGFCTILSFICTLLDCNHTCLSLISMTRKWTGKSWHSWEFQLTTSHGMSGSSFYTIGSSSLAGSLCFFSFNYSAVDANAYKTKQTSLLPKGGEKLLTITQAALIMSRNTTMLKMISIASTSSATIMKSTSRRTIGSQRGR